MTPEKILVVFHEAATVEAIKNAGSSIFDAESYASSKWAGRPNSTVRLNIVNYKAIERLLPAIDITIRTDIEWSENLAQIYSQFDLVVINAIALDSSMAFVEAILAWKRNNPQGKPPLIFGTEGTWDSRLRSGSITKDAFNDIYFKEILLRHTARTDRPIYRKEKGTAAAIQEFELGIDLAVMPDFKNVNERKFITFVRAPEGRATKNNEAIDALKNKILEQPELAGFEIREFIPPYTAAEYWQVLASSAFLIFTSIGETFSYALNDAKALGVVTLLPEEMYFTDIDGKYVVDTYPQVGIRYRSIPEAIQIVCNLASNLDEFERESKESRAVIERNFSLEAVSRNWREIFQGNHLNNNRLFIYGKRFSEWDQVLGYTRRLGAAFALPYRNKGFHALGPCVAEFDQNSGVTRILDSVTESEGKLRRTVDLSRGFVETFTGPELESLDIAEQRSFLQLICRSYKISEILIDRDLEHEMIVSACEGLTMYGGIRDRIVPISTNWVD